MICQTFAESKSNDFVLRVDKSCVSDCLGVCVCDLRHYCRASAQVVLQSDIVSFDFAKLIANNSEAMKGMKFAIQNNQIDFDTIETNAAAYSYTEAQHNLI